MRDFRNPRYKVLRDREECIECDLCVRQCANEVHYRDEKTGALRADSMKCVNCQRCTLLCPTRALAITRWPQVDAGSAVWPKAPWTTSPPRRRPEGCSSPPWATRRATTSTGSICC